MKAIKQEKGSFCDMCLKKVHEYEEKNSLILDFWARGEQGKSGAKGKKKGKIKMYYDRNGKLIKAGMVLKNIRTGDRDDVIEGECSLGFSASELEIYPLDEFNLSEWEIVEEY